MKRARPTEGLKRVEAPGRACAVAATRMTSAVVGQVGRRLLGAHRPVGDGRDHLAQRLGAHVARGEHARRRRRAQLVGDDVAPPSLSSSAPARNSVLGLVPIATNTAEQSMLRTSPDTLSCTRKPRTEPSSARNSTASEFHTNSTFSRSARRRW